MTRGAEAVHNAADIGSMENERNMKAPPLPPCPDMKSVHEAAEHTVRSLAVEIAKSECGGWAAGSKCVFTFNSWPNLNHNSLQEGSHCWRSFRFQSKVKLVRLHRVSSSSDTPRSLTLAEVPQPANTPDEAALLLLHACTLKMLHLHPDPFIPNWCLHDSDDLESPIRHDGSFFFYMIVQWYPWGVWGDRFGILENRDGHFSLFSDTEMEEMSVAARHDLCPYDLHEL